jgi:hypothetical protein
MNQRKYIKERFLKVRHQVKHSEIGLSKELVSSLYKEVFNSGLKNSELACDLIDELIEKDAHTFEFTNQFRLKFILESVLKIKVSPFEMSNYNQ